MAHRKNLTLSPLGACISLPSLLLYQYLLSDPTQFLSWLWIIALMLLHVSILYGLASQLQRAKWGELWRGAMIGLNAGLNACLIDSLFGWTECGLFLGGLVFLSAFLYISRQPFYHSILGWSNWLLPMSWGVNIPGALIFCVNALFSPIGYLHPILRGLRIRIYVDIPSCTFTTVGGLIRPVRGFSGLNMGNFIFINPGWEHLLAHEIGHLFSLAALGSGFHYIGGIDECYLQARYWEAYAEYLADSYAEPRASVLSMWR